MHNHIKTTTLKKMKDIEVNGESDLPPFLKTWKNVYILVAGTLLLLIVLFYAFTLFFA